MIRFINEKEFICWLNGALFTLNTILTAYIFETVGYSFWLFIVFVIYMLVVIPSMFRIPDDTVTK